MPFYRATPAQELAACIDHDGVLYPCLRGYKELVTTSGTVFLVLDVNDFIGPAEECFVGFYNARQ